MSSKAIRVAPLFNSSRSGVLVLQRLHFACYRFVDIGQSIVERAAEIGRIEHHVILKQKALRRVPF